MTKKGLRAHTIKLFKQFSGQRHTLTIPRAYVDMTGSHLEALLLNQIVFWSDHTKDPDGWFYKSYEEWHEELGMSAYQVKRAATALAGFGVETKLKKANGAPTVHYRLNQDVFIEAIFKFLEIPNSSSSEIQDFEETEDSITEEDQKKTAEDDTAADLPENPDHREAVLAYQNSMLDDIEDKQLYYAVDNIGLPYVLEAIQRASLKSDPGKRTGDYMIGIARGLKAEGWQPNDNAAPASMFANQTVV